MSSKYEKQVCKEEEGLYHRREYSHGAPVSPSSSRRGYTTTTTSKNHQLSKHRSPSRSSGDDSDDCNNDNFEEWTTSKRKVNHKTRQVETRVSRQLLMEDGRVIADSGPQVTTRIKEDNKVEECEREKAPKNRSRFEALENAPEDNGLSTGRVLGEKKEIQRVSREVREENMQYHDERFKELTGSDVHRKAIQAPHELITINDDRANERPRGKMVHYSNKGKKYQDTDEILEVAKLAIDGSITKERKHTKHHEEHSDDEIPDEKGEAETLRKKPIATRSQRKHFDYVNDFDNFSVPSSSDDEDNNNKGSGRIKSSHSKHHSPGRRSNYSTTHRDDQVFPRYERDPLLNSLHEADFKPHTSQQQNTSHIKSHPLRRTDSPIDNYSDSEDHASTIRGRGGLKSASSPHRAGSGSRLSSSAAAAGAARHQSPVEIPEEYRVNKERLMGGGGGGSHTNHRSSSKSLPHHHHHNARPSSQLSSRSRASRHEDAGVQVHLTDEEEQERRSHNSHELTARKIEKQHNSNRNSKRNYFYGDSKQKQQQQQHQHQRAHSISSDSVESSAEKTTRIDRKHGVQSRDSGFRSPDDHQHQIYSVSNKHQQQRDHQVVSPTPSAGQRSVKTTTTTISAGLAERPPRRHERELQASPRRQRRGSVSSLSSDGSIKRELRNNKQPKNHKETQQQFDNISVASFNPNATKIKVSYTREPRVEEMRVLRDRSADSARLSQLRNRLDTMQQQPAPGDAVEHFDYRTVVANLTPINNNRQRHHQIQTINNVHSIVQDSPFYANTNNNGKQMLPLMNNENNDNNHDDAKSTITQLELVASSTSGFGSDLNPADSDRSSAGNNNSYMLNQFIKANEPSKKRSCIQLNGLTGDSSSSSSNGIDRQSMVSSNCSLKSCRTYNIVNINDAEDDFEDDLSSSNNNIEHNSQSKEKTEVDESQCEHEVETLETCPRPPAWIFNPNDGSTQILKPPPKPAKPATPETKTEVLAESRGGRSYYLELVEPDSSSSRKAQPAKQQQHRAARPRSVAANNHPNQINHGSSMDSLLSKWSSMNTLSASVTSNKNVVDQLTAKKAQIANKQPTSSSISSNRLRDQSRFAKSTPKLINDQSSKLKTTTANNLRTNPSSIKNSQSRIPLKSLSRSERQICPAKLLADDDDNDDTTPTSMKGSQVHIPFGLRSKSSSCLKISSTKPTKYSIYGGLRSKDDKGPTKPVPRLSYSRAIGPRSQRPNGLQQVKTLPSRYLKMK